MRDMTLPPRWPPRSPPRWRRPVVRTEGVDRFADTATDLADAQTWQRGVVALAPDTPAQFRAGDPDAVRLVYREYGRMVFAVTSRALGQRELAEEATQQTFVQAWRSADTFDPGRELGPWLVTIARRVAIDIHRREARRSATSLEAVGPGDPSLVVLPPSAEAIHEVAEVRRAIDELPADEREIVRLLHLGGTHADRGGRAPRDPARHGQVPLAPGPPPARRPARPSPERGRMNPTWKPIRPWRRTGRWNEVTP